VIWLGLATVLCQTPGDVPEDRQCGVYAGFVALEAMGVATSLEEIRRKLGKGTSEGYSLKALATALSGNGVDAHPVKMTLDELERLRVGFVFLPYMRAAHYLVLEKFDADNVDLINPPGVLQIPRRAFEGSWDGYGLLLLPTGRSLEEVMGPPRTGWLRWAALAVGIVGVSAAALILLRRKR
jgi:ABC-type bacteriocin/lantibiotic exporter with double-glycine peptidase domain